CRSCESGSCSPAPPSEHLRRERNDLEEALGAKLARHRSEDARADRLLLIIQQHRGVVVEADIAAVGAADLFMGAHDDRLRDIALLHLGVGDGFLDRHHDYVADRRVAATRAAEHLDTLDFAGAGIVGDAQDRSHLYHGRSVLALRLLEHPADAPSFVARKRRRFDDQYAIALVALALFVMGHEAHAAADPFAVERMGHQPIDLDHDRFGHFGADHDTLAAFDSLTHYFACASTGVLFCRMSVRIRASSRRDFR